MLFKSSPDKNVRIFDHMTPEQLEIIHQGRVNAIREAFAELERLHSIDAHKIYTIGDSHSQTLANTRLTTPDAVFAFLNLYIGGITARGINRDTSSSQAKKHILRYLENIPEKGKIVFFLGNVDCNYVIPKKWYVTGHSPYEMALESSRNYRQFVLDHLAAKWNLYVVGTFPPSTKQDPYGASHIARVYNKDLALWCEGLGIPFIEIHEFATDNHTGIRKADLTLADDDHHLDRKRLKPPLLLELKRKGLFEQA